MATWHNPSQELAALQGHLSELSWRNYVWKLYLDKKQTGNSILVDTGQVLTDYNTTRCIKSYLSVDEVGVIQR